jgi:hypothetical protein
MLVILARLLLCGGLIIVVRAYGYRVSPNLFEFVFHVTRNGKELMVFEERNGNGSIFLYDIKEVRSSLCSRYEDEIISR